MLTREDEALWTELDNVTTIHNPLPFYPGPDRVSPCTAKQAIAVGRYTWQKGFDLLIEAWKRVAGPSSGLDVANLRGGDPTIYARMVEEAGLRRTCRLEGVTDDVVGRFCEKFRFCAFFAFRRVPGWSWPKRWPAEYLRLRSPVLRAEDIIRDGEDGLLAKNGGCGGPGRKDMPVDRTDELRKRMGSRAREHVRRFDIDTIMQQWRQTFR